MGQFSSGQRLKKLFLFSFCITDRGETIEEYLFLIFPGKMGQKSVLMCLRYTATLTEFQPYRG